MNKDFWVECGVCGTQYLNWSGSTPCCGSLTFIVDTTIEDRLKKINKILDNIKK